MRVGVLGLGNVGKALAHVLAGKEDLRLLDRSAEETVSVARSCGAKPAESLRELMEGSDYVYLAVKPQDLPEVAKAAAAHARKNQVIVSVAAGITSEQLRKWFKCPVVRLMPNMALKVGQAVLALEQDLQLDQRIKAELTEMLQPAGWVIWLSADQIDSVGALSGSGLAYLLTVLEALADGGVALGLKPELALQITAQTMRGAAELVREGKATIGELRSCITSPGGTTIEGMRVLEKGGVRSAFMEAVIAAHARSMELRRPAVD
jgi:pyrroline-5-carboxylate reductase